MFDSPKYYNNYIKKILNIKRLKTKYLIVLWFYLLIIIIISLSSIYFSDLNKVVTVEKAIELNNYHQSNWDSIKTNLVLNSMICDLFNFKFNSSDIENTIDFSQNIDIKHIGSIYMTMRTLENSAFISYALLDIINLNYSLYFGNLNWQSLDNVNLYSYLTKFNSYQIEVVITNYGISSTNYLNTADIFFNLFDKYNTSTHYTISTVSVPIYNDFSVSSDFQVSNDYDSATLIKKINNVLLESTLITGKKYETKTISKNYFEILSVPISILNFLFLLSPAINNILTKSLKDTDYIIKISPNKDITTKIETNPVVRLETENIEIGNLKE